MGDATAIWFVQPVGKMLHVIDYLEASDHGLEWYAKVLKDKPYVYGRHFFPHDIESRDFSSDGRTRFAIAESLGLRPAVVVPRGHIADRIQAMRTMMPRFVFDEEKCYAGIEALKVVPARLERDAEDLGRASGALVGHRMGPMRWAALRLAWQEDTPAVQVPTTFYHPGRGLWGRR